jgi:hypothetical protein
MVHSAVLSFTCGSLREVCMEARAVTAGLPALTGGGGCRRSSAIRVVHLPWKGLFCRFESTGSRDYGILGLVVGALVLGRSILPILLELAARINLRPACQRVSRSWRLKVWIERPWCAWSSI